MRKLIVIMSLTCALGVSARLDPYKGQVLAIRNFYYGKRLRYRATGELDKGGQAGSWTRDAFFRITEVSLEPDKVVFSGERLDAAYSDGHVLAQKRGHGKLKIEVPVVASAEGLGNALERVFLTPSERVENFIAARCLTPNQFNKVPRGDCADSGVCRAGGRVSAPRPIVSPDPEYTELARTTRLEGTVVLWLVVGVDGKAADICIERSLGYGLDEKAVEAVRSWKFDPAKRDGKPVPVAINIEITFRLY